MPKLVLFSKISSFIIIFHENIKLYTKFNFHIKLRYFKLDLQQMTSGNKRLVLTCFMKPPKCVDIILRTSKDFSQLVLGSSSHLIGCCIMEITEAGTLLPDIHLCVPVLHVTNVRQDIELV